MAEFYDELFDVEDIPDFDVDVVFPDGSKIEMFLPNKPKIGELVFGHFISELVLNENYKDGEFYGTVILKRKGTNS